MLLRRVARPLLAGIFIQAGIAALRDPKGHADMAAPIVDRVSEVAPIGEPPSTITMVRIDAGVKIGAGTLLALGKAPRLSAVALAASLVPTTAAAHRFWEIDDPNQRMDHQVHFMKNLGLLGGLMLAAADTEGKPSFGWRARHARQTSAATAELFHRDVAEGLGHLTGGLAEVASRTGVRVTDAASRTGERVVPAAARAGERVAERTSHLLGEAEAASARAVEQARKSKTLKEARKASTRARKRTAKRLEKTSAQASKRLDKVRKEASKRLERVSEQASKESARQLDRAANRAHEARAKVESRLR